MKISDSMKHELAQLAKFGLPLIFVILSTWGHFRFYGEPSKEVLTIIILVSGVIMHHFLVIEYKLKYKLGLIDWEWQTYTSHFRAFVSRQLKR